MAEYFPNWQNWAWSLGVIAVAAIAGLIAHYIFYLAAERLSGRTKNQVDQSVVRYSRRPARLIFPVLAIFIVSPGLPLELGILSFVRHALALILIASIAWLFISLLNVLEDALQNRYRMDVADNLEARRIKTQVQVLRRIMVLVVGVVALAVMLMTFPTIWNIGAGLFASAGAAGLVVGMAARPTLSNLLAGVQIALTEPIRLDDVVVVEGEWGRIEQIETTYVVVRSWDLRRIILPLSYFIEKPFQNWTRTSANLLGTVFLYVDYTVPVDQVRNKLHQILEGSELWDRKAWALQVTNADAKTVEIRALMSAANSGQAFDLRCLVREKLIAFMQEQYPGSLPRIRAEIPGTPQPA